MPQWSTLQVARATPVIALATVHDRCLFVLVGTDEQYPTLRVQRFYSSRMPSPPPPSSENDELALALILLNLIIKSQFLGTIYTYNPAILSHVNVTILLLFRREIS